MSRVKLNRFLRRGQNYRNYGVLEKFEFESIKSIEVIKDHIDDDDLNIEIEPLNKLEKEGSHGLRGNPLNNKIKESAKNLSFF